MTDRRSGLPQPIRRTIERLIHTEVDNGAICGAVLALDTGKNGAWAAAFGRQEPTTGAAPMRADTVFDLASLTKVIATLPVILALITAGELDLDDPVKRFLPQFRDEARDRITIRHLLAHTSGLPASRRYYRDFETADRMRTAILAERPATTPGSVTTYSDIGFIVLGFVVETVAELPLDAAAKSLVFDPLGMRQTGFNPVPRDPRYAPTEALDGAEPLRGIVHDRNARLLGGVAGHAGLFAPAADIVTYLRAWLGETSAPWGEAMTATALSRQTPPNGPARGLGWVLTDQDSAALFSDAWPAGGAGHTGFTGTSIVIDPHARTQVVLLTNAIRCGRDKRRLEALRQGLHRCLANASGKTAD